MKRRKQIDADTLMPYVLTAGPLLIISAFFVPVIVIMMVQDMLFFSYDHWSFIRPQAAYLGFGGAMIWLAVCLFSLYVVKAAAERKNWSDWSLSVHSLLMTAAFPVFILSIYHYAYLDEAGVKVNSYWSVSETDIHWEDVENVSRTVEEDTQRVTSYTFSSNSKSLTIPYATEDYQTRQAVNRVLSEYEWEVEDKTSEASGDAGDRQFID
ncbi:MAG: hypothetical protein EA344_03975 [Alkalicoccus sp.]|nr:MAG: hypothetical protein EA344_03975 [Alkalicoccus sp.]